MKLKPIIKESVLVRPDDSLMSVKELSVYLGVKEQWIYERVSLNEIPFIKMGKLLRFKKSAIDQWLKSQETPAINPLSRSLRMVR